MMSETIRLDQKRRKGDKSVEKYSPYDGTVTQSNWVLLFIWIQGWAQEEDKQFLSMIVMELWNLKAVGELQTPELDHFCGWFQLKYIHGSISTSLSPSLK